MNDNESPDVEQTDNDPCIVFDCEGEMYSVCMSPDDNHRGPEDPPCEIEVRACDKCDRVEVLSENWVDVAVAMDVIKEGIDLAASPS